MTDSGRNRAEVAARTLTDHQDAKEAALETEALEDDYQSSYGAGASLNKQNDEAAKISKKMGETAKEAADELEGQINSYEDAEAGLPPASGKSGDKGGK